MPNWIGDMVMATPILTDVRKAFPDAHITAMCRTPLSDLLKEDLDIDELFFFSKVNSFGRRSEQRDIIEKIRRGTYDLGILLTQSFSSAWLFWRGNVKRRLGYKGKCRNLLLTDKLDLPVNIRQQHLVTTYKMVLAPLGIPVSETKPRLFLKDKELEEAQTLLKRLGISPEARLVGINPGAAYGSAKCWLPERFRAVTEKLLKLDNVQIVYFGDAVTQPLVKEFCQGLPVTNLAGLTTLRELACLIKLCKVVLTNDSGPMHIAAAVGTPLVALFGSTNEIATGPYKTGTVIHKHVDCSPCYKRVCPIDFRCMKRIETDEVYEALVKKLNQTPYVKKSLEKNRA
ncbi:MAG TPA: lipopolysaccharide heptosyltransferase II, partial [Rhabdochlamydiaceae bacterium]|nr:lipopolysaccharide heptosyltransferase II [Rhabdochlamydiaceae bacterium]